MANMTNTLYVVIDASGATAGGKTVTNAVNSITQSVINLNMNINQINGHTNNMAKSAVSNFNKMGGAVDRIGSGLRTLLGIFAAVQGVRLFESFIREIQDVDRVYNGFIAMMNVTTGDIAKSKVEYQYVAATAKAYGVSLQSLLHTYAKLAAATKEILTTNQTKKVFEAMTAVSTVLHAEATTIDRMFNAVIQIASKGQLMMEELKQQLGEHLPGALALAATAMNMTMGELMDAMKKGQIGAKEFLSSFPDTLMEKFGAAAEVASKSLHATYSRLKSSVFMMFQEMSSNGIALGMSAVLISINKHVDSGSDSFKRFGQVVGEAFIDLAKFIDQITPQDVEAFANGVVNVTKAFVEFVKMIAAATGFLIEHKAEVMLVVEAYVAFKVYSGVAAAQTALLSAGVVTSAGAFTLLNGAIGVVAAALAGWQIGTYLKEKFLSIELFGIALAAGLTKVPVQIAGAFEIMGIAIPEFFAKAFQSVVNKINSFMASVSNLSSDVLKSMGFDGFKVSAPIKLDFASGYTREKSAAAARIAADLKMIDDSYSGAADSAIAAKQKLKTGETDIAGALGLSEKGIKDAQSLMERYNALKEEATAAIGGTDAKGAKGGTTKTRKEKTVKPEYDFDADAMKTYQSYIKDTTKSIQENQLSTADLTKAQHDLAVLMMSPDWWFMSDAMKADIMVQFQALEASEKLTASYKARQELMAEGARMTEELQSPQETFIRQLQHLNELLDAGAISWDTYNAAVEKSKTTLEKAQDGLEKNVIEKDNVIKNAMKSMQSGLADFLFDPFEKGVKGMLQSFGTMIQKMIAEAAAAQLMKALFGGTASGNSKDGGGILGGLLEIGAGLFKADGGPVQGNKSYIVGERGPELFTPSSSGNITPNHQMQQGGALTINQYLPQGTPAETKRAAGVGARNALTAFNSSRRYA